jgi:hypothetical protein
MSKSSSVCIECELALSFSGERDDIGSSIICVDKRSRLVRLVERRRGRAVAGRRSGVQMWSELVCLFPNRDELPRRPSRGIGIATPNHRLHSM